jgi:membrane protein required for colicin V production
LNFLDIIIFIVLLWGAWKGFSNGFIISVASFLALMLGIWGAIKFSDYSAAFLTNHFTITSKYLKIISFAVTFLIIIILVHLIARLIDKLISAVALGPVNKLLGTIFGILKYGFIVSVFLIILNNIDHKIHFIPDSFKNDSILFNPMTNISLRIYPSLENFYTDNIKDIKPVNLQSIH